MTGFCGWIGDLAPGGPPEETLERMAGGFRSAAAESAGSAAAPDAALHLRSWRQCFGFADRDGLWVAIDGYPEWSDPDLAAVAARDGHGAALARAWRDNGEDLFRHLHGPFSFAVIDRTDGSALLAIDRLAIHPLCYAHIPGRGLVFGSSADTVKAHPAVGGTVTAQGIFNYLYFYVSPAPGTIYREQRKLLPAQYLRYRDGAVTLGFYWHMPYRESGRADIDALDAELMALLDKATARAMEGESFAGTGAFLSGGLDSSTVVGQLARRSDGAAKCFTIGFAEDGFDEMAYASAAARHFKARHEQLYVTPADTVALLPRIAEAYDEPYGNSSAIPAYYCARMARRNGVELLLAGDGGDELFGGNERYAQQLRFELFGALPGPVRWALGALLTNRLIRGRGPRLLRRAQSFLARAMTPLPDRMQTYNLFRTVPPGEIFEDGFMNGLDPGQPMGILRDVFARPPSGTKLQRMMQVDLQSALADNDLRKVTRMCELAGVRAKFPLLDEDLVAFSARLPSDYLVRKYELRWFYRRAMRNFLPAETLSKEKHGFGMPFQHWTRTDATLEALLCDNTVALKGRGLLRPAFIDRVIADHRSGGDAGLGALVWDLAMMEMWLQAH